MSGTDVAADVPDKFDCVIDGYGYVTARAVDPNMPFRVQQQMLSYSPTFVERQNVSNSYGDNAQDFFLTIRQRDWSLGEQQRYFRAGQDGRYWMGSAVDVTVPGQVSMRRSVKSLTFAAAAVSASPLNAVSNTVVAVTATKLYEVDSTGAITDEGVHGLGATPSSFAVVSDGNAAYLSTTAAGTVGVRRYGGGGVFGTFSATGADSLEFLNNTLYGVRTNASCDLIQYDTAGAVTTLFTWKDAQGNGVTSTYTRLKAYGGQLLILRQRGVRTSELWVYDGSGTRRAADFPASFQAWDMEESLGIVYISGVFVRKNGGSLEYKPAVYFYQGGNIGLLWQANSYSTGADKPALAAFDSGVVFTDDITASLMFYNPATGGVHSIGAYTVAGSLPILAGTSSFFVHVRSGTAGYFAPDPSTTVTSSYVISSLIDFDSSLTKQFRGIKVEFDAASDGNGGTVDIAYQIDSLTGAWTTLQSGAVSGSEYTFSSVSGHAIAIKITLNKGTSTAGPTLRSCSVRGAPVLPPYRMNEFILDLGGDTSQQNPVRRRDGSDHNLTGEEMRANLAAAIQTQAPIQVTDRTGTYTAMPEPANCEFDLTRPGQWYARIRLREV